MRNGIYRVWTKGPEALSSGALMLNDGDLVACNPRFGFFGRYRYAKRHFTANIACHRLGLHTPAINLPDLERFELHLDGPASEEFATLTGTIPEVPDFALPFEFAWLCEI